MHNEPIIQISSQTAEEITGLLTELKLRLNPEDSKDRDTFKRAQDVIEMLE